MSITASIVALTVILVRIPFRKAPKIFSYILWSAVLFRLVFPFSIESIFSLMPTSRNVIPQEITFLQNPTIQTGVDRQTEVDFIDIPITMAAHNDSPIVANDLNPSHTLLEKAGFIWLIGCIALLLYAITGYISLKRHVYFATRIRDNIFEADKIKTPFVLGLIRPKIYFPTHIDPLQYDYILKHEQTHIRRRDYLIKPLAYIVLAVHWFNPLMWLSYFLMSRDMEMSCDEAVLRKASKDIRKDYSSSLLNLSIDKSSLLNPIAFGESNVKERVVNVLNFKKTKMWIMLVSIIAVAFVLVACSLNPITQNDTGLVITDTSMEMNDRNFLGTETHTVELTANSVITIDTRGNVFDILIVNQSGTPMPFFGNGMSGSNMRGTIPEDGEYTITIEGNGQFSISWEQKDTTAYVSNIDTNHHRPEGEVIHQTFSFEPFNGISINGLFNVVYRQSDEHRIELKMYESIFEITEMDVVGHVLQVHQNLSGIVFQEDDETPRLYIYAPYLTEVALDGVITARNWEAIHVEDFTLHIDGVTTLEMSGSAETATFRIDGVSSIHALGFETRSTVVDIDGVSTLSVAVENDLNVSIDGLATVEYRGNPTIVQRNVDDFATLRQID